jgi:hypothetical protein
MEISINETSIHYRLSQSEVEAFEHEGVCKQKVVVGEEPLMFLLQRTSESEMRVTLHTNLITLLVPKHLADEWTSGQNEKLETQDGALHLLVEVVENESL